MNKFKLLIITIFCLIPSIVFPFVSYNVLIKDGKLVLLMGDAHSTEIDEINTQHIDYLFAVLNNSLSKLSNKVNCLIEIHPSLFKALYLNKQSNDANMAKTIDHLCSSYIKNAFFNFVPCDTRGQESDIIMSVGGSINNLISEMVFKDETPNEDIQIPEKASFEFKKFEKMINDMGRCNYSLKMQFNI
ncbi:MAG: hypothetical protein P4L22_03360 [Candidatus Babeliales bacterium]|nr:hypothetical protein [Candidatus Babeliales bacterium]